MKVERFLKRVSAVSKERDIQVRVPPDVAAYLFEHNGKRLADLEKELELTLDIRDDPRLKREEVRIVLQSSGKDVTQDFTGQKP
jgi:Ribonuclease G/E